MADKGKKKYQQTYSKSWESDPLLKEWLGPDPSGISSKAYCRYCKCSLTAHKKDLLVHGKSQKHVKKMSFDIQAKSCKALSFTPSKTNAQKVAELKLSVFIAEHSSIATADHLCELLPQIDSNSKILMDLKMHRTKCAMLLKNVIAVCMLQDLIRDIANSPYSLVIDESTDVGSEKVLCLMIKYFSCSRNQIVTTFYRLILVEKCDAQSLYNAVTEQLTKDNLQVKNLVGIGVDGASVMVGAHNSFSTLMKSVVPDLIIVKCVCHSLHLCAENACKELPRQLEFFVREVHNYFAHSPKRISEYKKLYLILKEKNPKKISKLSGTRWLARHEAVSTILEQWAELYEFFKKAKIDDKCFTAEQIVDIMNRPAYKAYLTFLKTSLDIICKTNTLFQSDEVNPFVLFQDIFLLFKNFLNKIVVPSQLQKISDSNLIDFDFEKYLMHTESIYFGYDFQQITKTLNQNDKEDVQRRCKNFIVSFCKQLQQRLPNNINILEKINIFRPEIATSQKKQNIVDIAASFQRFSIDDCQNEWESIPNKSWCNTDNIVNFWSEVYNDKDSADNPRFKNVANLAIALLSLPISNATVERAFSTYNIIKNKIRNRLSLEMVQAIMMVRYFLRIDKIDCRKFQPTADMLAKFNVSMYDFKNNLDTDSEVIRIIDELSEL